MPCRLVHSAKTQVRKRADEARPRCGRVELAMFSTLLSEQ
jgi:hypothetical protein